MYSDARSLTILSLAGCIGYANLISAAAVPVARRAATTTTWAPVQAATSVVPVASASALASPAQPLDDGTRAFLDRYQPDSNAAAQLPGSAALDAFPATGLCMQEYPCFSVDRVAFATFDAPSGLTQTQAGQLLDAILAQPNISTDASRPNTVVNGARIVASDLTLDVMAPSGALDSAVLAGSVFDLVKAQGLQPGTDAIRGVAASTQPGALPTMGLCVYPTGADAGAAANFCQGKELDGSATVSSTTAGGPSKAKRFSVDELLTGFCAHIDIPLICPGSA